MTCLLMSAGAGAVTRDDASVPGLPVFRIDASDSVTVLRPLLSGMLDEGAPFAIIGGGSMIGGALPEHVHTWPETGAWVLDPREGLGVHGIAAANDEDRVNAFAVWQRANGDEPTAPGRGDRVAVARNGSRTVALEFVASTPGTICRSFSREMHHALFGDATPSHAERRAFRSEIRRWCQYGIFSHYAAAPRNVVIEPFSDTKDALLTLTTEWAFIRGEDRVERSRVGYAMWVKTVGDGAGFGFTRRSGYEGVVDRDGTIHNLLDLAIHSGWGGLAHHQTISAWPLNSTYPGVANTLVFECDGLDAHLRFDCPVRPRLRRLYPQDSQDQSVTASKSVKFDVVGNVRVAAGGSDGAAPKITFGLDVMHGTTDTAQTALSLVHIFSNADTAFHRSTHWIPDLSALRQWIAARNHRGNLMRATPLASTLNPRYEILWELPLRGNAGRVIPYYTIYEAGWNTCDASNVCADFRTRPNSPLPVKSRVAWFDAVMLRFPTY
ncbi:hypothetical protein [Luteibacter aegosomatissinici]|uniref:hypothetical protein n=1 Tax=Luteibacter aegosomatissinici TaxID=2911539 RepID=UPI001FF97AB0|nr:hypothetical protein [Luteibacter aegosomatissinici]UPG93531.1 hypothetical protein L2Y97_17035 [Luteibacter aegosomatissinici]